MSVRVHITCHVCGRIEDCEMRPGRLAIDYRLVYRRFGWRFRSYLRAGVDPDRWDARVYQDFCPDCVSHRAHLDRTLA